MTNYIYLTNQIDYPYDGIQFKGNFMIQGDLLIEINDSGEKIIIAELCLSLTESPYWRIREKNFLPNNSENKYRYIIFN